MANYRKKEARDWAWANMRGTRRAEYLAAALVVAVIAALCFFPPAAQIARITVRWVSG